MTRWLSFLTIALLNSASGLLLGTNLAQANSPWENKYVYYFNADKSDVTLTTNYNTTTENFKIITIKTGKQDPTQFNKVRTPYTKPTSASWGNTRYYGKNFDNFLMHNKVTPVIIFNISMRQR